MGKRARMFWRWTAIFGVALLVVGTLLFTFRDPLLRRLAETRIQKNTGLRAQIGELRSAFGSGAFEVRDLMLYNVEEFGGSLLARIPILLVDLDPEQAAQGVFHLRKLQLHLAEFHLVKDQTGRFNLDGVEKTARAQLAKRFRRRREELLHFGGIDRLELTLGHVRYTDLARPDRKYELDLQLNNEVVTTLKTEEDLQTWIGAMVFRIVMQEALRKQSLGSATPPEPGL